MSWDKNTYDMSTIRDIIVLLDALQINYKLTKIKNVSGRGNNDNLDNSYTLQKLEVNNIIYIDQMIRTTDCDTDDTIITHKFLKKTGVPKNFKEEIEIKNS
jgi:hypothetical protein